MQQTRENRDTKEFMKKEKNMLIEKINSVKEFHEVFKIGSREVPEGSIPEAEYILRHRLMQEENDEYLDACKRGDLVEIADALGDKMYILFGSILKHGLQHKIEEIFDEIQKSNMSKLDDNGQPIFREDGKIMKSKNYFKPNIKKILDRK
jgi:predicted HAD superfamily Cof-like phosphohydrolase